MPRSRRTNPRDVDARKDLNIASSRVHRHFKDLMSGQGQVAGDVRYPLTAVADTLIREVIESAIDDYEASGKKRNHNHLTPENIERGLNRSAVADVLATKTLPDAFR